MAKLPQQCVVLDPIAPVKVRPRCKSARAPGTTGQQTPREEDVAYGASLVGFKEPAVAAVGADTKCDAASALRAMADVRRASAIRIEPSVDAATGKVDAQKSSRPRVAGRFAGTDALVVEMAANRHI